MRHGAHVAHLRASASRLLESAMDNCAPEQRRHARRWDHPGESVFGVLIVNSASYCIMHIELNEVEVFPSCCFFSSRIVVGFRFVNSSNDEEGHIASTIRRCETTGTVE